MNFKKLGILFSVSALMGINLTTTKALTQEYHASTSAEPSIQFGEAISQGKCVIADQLAGADGRTLSIALDDFVSEDGKRNRCILRINTTVPSGFHVQDVQVLYQGSADIAEKGASASLSRSYIFNGGAFGQVTAEPQTSQFTETVPLLQEQDDLTVVSASCGGEGQLGINMIAQASEDAAIFIDTTDINAGQVQLSFDIVPCDSSSNSETPQQLNVGLK